MASETCGRCRHDRILLADYDRQTTGTRMGWRCVACDKLFEASADFTGIGRKYRIGGTTTEYALVTTAWLVEVK